MKQLRRLHLVAGAFGLIAFVLTGQYMHWHLHHLHGVPDGPRLMYRSAHIYLLWASLLNMALTTSPLSVSKRLGFLSQGIASSMLAITPFLLCLSFFLESTNQNLTRALARVAIYLSVVGVLVCLGVQYHASLPDQER